MRWAFIVVFMLFLTLASGCGSKASQTGTLTDEQKKIIIENDDRVDVEERSGSGTATKAPKRK